VRHGVVQRAALVLTLAGLFGCTKIPPPPADAPAELATEALPASDSIPLAWGKLVSVTPGTPVDQLWFQNDSGVIHIVGFSHNSNRFRSSALVILRK
jgi:hypothetical protein